MEKDIFLIFAYVQQYHIPLKISITAGNIKVFKIPFNACEMNECTDALDLEKTYTLSYLQEYPDIVMILAGSVGLIVPQFGRQR
jgi:hypothetical protein